MLLFALSVEALALRTAVRAANALREGESWLAFIRRSKSPEIPVMLLEDFGAVTGILLALLCVGLAIWTGDSRWDGVGSLAIGLLLGTIAVLMGAEMKSLLIGESATRRGEQSIRSSIESHPLVRQVLHMRTQHLGPDELLVGAKVEFDTALVVGDLARAIDEIEVELRARTRAHVIYIEPDLSH